MTFGLGFSDLRRTDSGWYGVGIYFTTHSIYALQYALPVESSKKIADSKRKAPKKEAVPNQVAHLVVAWVSPGRVCPKVDTDDQGCRPIAATYVRSPPAQTIQFMLLASR